MSSDNIDYKTHRAMQMIRDGYGLDEIAIDTETGKYHVYEARRHLHAERIEFPDGDIILSVFWIRDMALRGALDKLPPPEETPEGDGGDTRTDREVEFWSKVHRAEHMMFDGAYLWQIAFDRDTHRQHVFEAQRRCASRGLRYEASREEISAVFAVRDWALSQRRRERSIA